MLNTNNRDNVASNLSGHSRASTDSPPSPPAPSNGTSSSSSRFRGVRKRKWGKWVAEIREPRKRSRIWLGSYFSPEAAARAFDVATFCLRGPSAKMNLPDLIPQAVRELPYGQISPKSVQRLALQTGAHADQTAKPSPSNAVSQSSPPSRSSNVLNPIPLAIAEPTPYRRPPPLSVSRSVDFARALPGSHVARSSWMQGSPLDFSPTNTFAHLADAMLVEPPPFQNDPDTKVEASDPPDSELWYFGPPDPSTS